MTTTAPRLAPTVPYTPQTAFDAVLFGIRAQGYQPSVRAQAVSASGEPAIVCQYRGDNGAACAMGMLIPDALYTPAWDQDGGLRAGRLLEGSPEILALFDLSSFDDYYLDFVNQLQHMHDDALRASGAEGWEREMHHFARRQGLTYTPPVMADATSSL